MDNREKKEYSEGGVIFEVEENGTYTFSATTNKGKTKVAKIVIHVSQPKDKIVIHVDKTQVTNQAVKVSISYGETELNNPDKYQYKIGSTGSWKTAREQEVIEQVEENTIIIARYFDGINSYKVESYNIQNIDKEKPKDFEYTVETTTNSIIIVGSTIDIGSEGTASENIGISKYEYSKDNGVTWQTQNSFTNLITGTYPIKMRAIDKAGNIRNGISNKSKVESETISLGTVSGSTITITSAPTTATNGNVTVNITYANNGLTKQYKKSTDSTWTTVSGTTASFTTDSNISVAVRYTDGINYFDGNTYNVQNIDKVAPNPFNIGASNIGASRFTITGASTTDAATSGCANQNMGIARYEYFVNNVNRGTTSITGLVGSTTYSVFVRAIDKAGNIRDSNTINVTTLEETVPYLPAGSTVINGNVNTGYTIRDKNNNEWVWIVVPRSLTESASNDTTIYTTLENYASIYRQPGYTDVWYEGCGLTEAQYNTNKSKMLNSIRNYGGFYIGRYELGTDTIRKESEQTLVKQAFIQVDKYACNYINCTQAQELCGMLSPESSITSSMLFGIQWDLTLKFLEEKASELGNTIQERRTKIINDTSTWGNFPNVSFTITRGKYSTDRGDTYKNILGSYSKPGAYVLLTTGATDRNKVLNIYDLTGNQSEWTLERNQNAGAAGPCTSRGGSYTFSGADHTVIYRYSNSVYNGYDSVGTRATCYK